MRIFFILLILKTHSFAQETYLARMTYQSNIDHILSKGLNVKKAFFFSVDNNKFLSSFVKIKTSCIPCLDSLVASNILIYWEPNRKQIFHYAPSDYFFSEQWHLQKISALEAWDYFQGDTSFVLGVVDSGVDYNHEDLFDNISYNYADPINGLDDDLDGYIDNYYGWDFGSSDNDPMIDGSGFLAHGSYICGAAAASTDNNIGIASPAFKCKFLPVKITDSSGNIINSNEGILYASMMGSKVINCSFGSIEYSQAEADIINYVTDSLDVLVIASSGNEGDNMLVYPAALDQVISVCSLDENDQKTLISNYGNHIDLGAPGTSIYSTSINDSYSFRSGTSVSAALVSGAAILLRSYFKNESSDQIKNRLIYSTDPYNNLSDYQGLLGTGRLNLRRAMNEIYISKFDVNLFPNPNQGEFEAIINIVESGNYEFFVFDILGKLYYHESFYTQFGVYNKKINLQYLESGQYFLKLSGNNFQKNVIFII